MGALLIAFGALFLLRNLDFVYFPNIGQYWPVILIGIGALQLLHSRCFIFPGAFLIALGGIFLARNFGYISSVGPFIWPVAIILFGVSLLMRNTFGPDWAGGAPGTPGAPPDSNASRLHEERIFGGIDRKITAQNFEGGRVSVIFAGAKIDLRNANIAQGAMIHADAVFGGISILVPDTWRVETHGTGVFGGYEDRTHKPAAADAPRLWVKGSAVFGGVEVRN
jgi:predicted membrane protein